MKKTTVYPNVQLRFINEKDQINLRNWKNQNKASFFYKKTITKNRQSLWFKGYLSHRSDFMFIVQVGDVDIGCMGIRLLDGKWDIYNVILGNPDFGKKGYMTQALVKMCNFVRSSKVLPITAKVIKDNPALEWYKRNGFEVMATFDDYVEIELRK